LAANGYGPMPPHITDREVKYPVTFMNFYDFVQLLNEYEIALATDSPSAEYDFRAQKIPGKSIIFRRKEN
jgi:hypothetical protein